MKRYVEALIKKINEERGSASLEFSALAIPLFIPVFIFLNQFSSLSANEEMARSLSREAVRVFVLSGDDANGRYAAEQVVRIGARHMGFNAKEVSAIELSITCNENPCITPNALVTATVVTTTSNHRTRASSQEYVSPWQ